MAKKKATRKSRPIVIEHLEKISSGVFEGYPQQVTGLIKQGQGVYALYRRDKLYYVGLASDLRSRIKWHLKDKHKGKWDRFSLYIMKKEEQIREVESLLVRIAGPKGNRVRGRLGRSRNLVRELQRAVKQQQEKERSKIFGEKGKAKQKKPTRRLKKAKGERVERPLKGLLGDWQRIYASYKGKEYKAKILPNGRIELNGQMYDTPSGAGKAVIDAGAVNGWDFWKYKNKSGDLVAIRDLR